MAKKSKEERKFERLQKREERNYSHVTLCPSCGQEVLDHMTKCPHCGAELTPSGYVPMDEAKMKKIKTVLYIVGIIAAIAVFIFTMSNK